MHYMYCCRAARLLSMREDSSRGAERLLAAAGRQPQDFAAAAQLLHQRLWRVLEDDAEFFRSSSTSLQHELRRARFVQVCRTFQHFCHGSNDLSLLVRGVSGPLAFRYERSHVRPAPRVPRAGMSSCTQATSYRLSMASVGWLTAEPEAVVRGADAQEVPSHTYMPAALHPDGSFVLL